MLPNERIVAVFHIVGEQGKKNNLTIPAPFPSQQPGVAQIQHGEKQRLSEMNPKFKTPEGCLQIASREPQVMAMLRVEPWLCHNLS